MTRKHCKNRLNGNTGGRGDLSIVKHEYYPTSRARGEACHAWFYGSKTNGARQTANFWAAGLRTFTWQVYLPGSSFASGTLNLNGTAFDFGVQPAR